MLEALLNACMLEKFIGESCNLSGPSYATKFLSVLILPLPTNSSSAGKVVMYTTMRLLKVKWFSLGLKMDIGITTLDQ